MSASGRFPSVRFPAQNRTVGFRVNRLARSCRNGTTWWVVLAPLAPVSLQDQNNGMAVFTSRHRYGTWAFRSVSSLCLMLAAIPSHACSLRMRKLTSLQLRHQAQSSFAGASVVVDAEVISPMRFGADWKEGLVPMAALRVIRSYKGHVADDVIPVVYITSCDVSLEQKGRRVRIMLLGDGVFRSEQGMNGAASSDLTEFNREVDRLVGQRRASAFARFPGEEAPPRKSKSVH